MMVTEKQLTKILKVAFDTSFRGSGISYKDAIQQSEYKDLRHFFGAADLLPLLQKDSNLVRDWQIFSEDKRTDGGWYLTENFEIGTIAKNTELLAAECSVEKFSSIEEAVAEYVIRELDFWSALAEENT